MLCPLVRAAVSRAGRWATRSPVCSRWVPCSGRLKAVFSNKQDSTSDSLPGLAGEAAVKLVELLFAVLTQADMTASILAIQGHWFCSADH